jgi:hypothetical protein
MKSSIVKMKTCLMMTLLVVGIPVLAAEMDHSAMDHSEMNRSKMILDKSLTKTPKTQSKGALQKLTIMPTSGKAREGGYDDRYVMESTDVSSILQIRCAQASRGLVMMNNAEWSRCGGKPDGAAQASRSTIDMVANEHVGHNM